MEPIDIQKMTEALLRGECLICKRVVKVSQVGGCVYGDCGHRLYRGKIGGPIESWSISAVQKS